MRKLITVVAGLAILLCFQCPDKQPGKAANKAQQKKVVVGAEQLTELLPELTNKRVALVANHTALVNGKHLADTLKELGVDLKKVMAPEHGFRGTADAGEYTKDGMDTKLGVPVISLYGKNKKPTKEQLEDVDIVLFDIQDVGVRFFTYIGTMHYVMEACAENGKKLIVLDRPNPNGNYVDGPVLNPAFKSFTGMHPVPVVHGMTVGEFARMINGEEWLPNGEQCELEVIPLKNWTHDDFYSLPVKPSPNLPTDQAIKLYPSVCFLEGTVISVGRGTHDAFQMIGNPLLKNMPYQFTPVSIAGMSKNPPFENQVCYGLDLRNVDFTRHLTLQYVIDMYNAYPDKDKFFVKYFDTLAGNDILREQIKQGLSEDQIRETWQPDLEKYREMRKKYLLYE